MNVADILAKFGNLVKIVVADISGILAKFGNLVKIDADILRICLRLRLGKVCRGHSEVSQSEKVVPKRVEVTDIPLGQLATYLAT